MVTCVFLKGKRPLAESEIAVPILGVPPPPFTHHQEANLDKFRSHSFFLTFYFEMISNLHQKLKNYAVNSQTLFTQHIHIPLNNLPCVAPVSFY